jgi:parallel beta-helix repeat protein
MQLDMHKDGMRLKTSTVILIGILLVHIFSSFTSFYSIGSAHFSTDFLVDLSYNTTMDGFGDYLFNSIQAAINKSEERGRISVLAGTYNENIVINKTSLKVFGQDPSITTIQGTGVGNTVNITNNYVDVSGFTIKNSGTLFSNAVLHITASHCKIIDTIIKDGNHGIYLDNCDNTTIYINQISSNQGSGIYLNQSVDSEINNNVISDNEHGIYAYKSSDTTITYNVGIESNSKNGVFLKDMSTHNTISFNSISSNGENGIYLLDQCNNNDDISNNDIFLNEDSGIRIENSSNNKNIKNNTVQENKNYGMLLVGSFNEIQDCVISENEGHGLFLFADDNSTIHSNTIHANTFDGIRLHNSTNNRIHTNIISNNLQYGVHVNYYTVNSKMYNNMFLGNSINARDISPDDNLNSWNDEQVGQPNIIGQTSINGNYWDDYNDISVDYRFDVNKFDNGALVDTTKPVITTPIVTPESQIQGGQTQIRMNITDNVKVSSVFVNITTPNAEINNYSIYENRNENIFSFSQVFSEIGTYSFHIACSDSRNWNTSDTYSFNILSGVAPTIVDNSQTIGEALEGFVFNATVTDDSDAASDLKVYAIWSHGSLSDNTSLVHATGDYFKRIIPLDGSTRSLTYHLYAVDLWGNAASTDTITVPIVDTKPPQISIIRQGSSSDDFPNSYTFAVNVTDNCAISSVFIQYWYDDIEKKTIPMDKNTNIGENYYEKIIIPQESLDKLYCVIYANDTSGNIADTKNPTAQTDGPYIGVVAEEVIFNASSSFDLDGNITEYMWEFGDGTKDYGIRSSHVYSSIGNYSVSLTVTDDEGFSHIAYTYCKIIDSIVIKANDKILDYIKSQYNITLSKSFYAYDSTGDFIVDTFIDPNRKLSVTHDGFLNISRNISFLISVNTDDIPKFIWNTTTNEIMPIVYTVGIVINTTINEEEQQAIYTVVVDKAKWIYIQIDDYYSDSSVVVTTINKTISPEFIWRRNNKIFVLDDPEVIYEFIFNEIYENVQSPSFHPMDGGIIDENRPTITITYNVPVTITYATFHDTQVKQHLSTTDNLVFTYTPPSYLDNGTYVFEIDAQAIYGNSFSTSSATFFYFSYGSAPEKSFIEQNLVMLFFSGLIGLIFILLFVFKTKQISLDHFLYIKNKKIVPFMKTIIFGPLSITIDEPEISKAEIYVDGHLKGTLTQAPFVWKWDEKAFMKHTLETKIFDEEGNYASSGEMEFYIFNNPL